MSVSTIRYTVPSDTWAESLNTRLLPAVSTPAVIVPSVTANVAEGRASDGVKPTYENVLGRSTAPHFDSTTLNCADATSVMDAVASSSEENVVSFSR
jgi:hypothetical protein